MDIENFSAPERTGRHKGMPNHATVESRLRTEGVLGLINTVTISS